MNVQANGPQNIANIAPDKRGARRTLAGELGVLRRAV